MFNNVHWAAIDKSEWLTSILSFFSSTVSSLFFFKKIVLHREPDEFFLERFNVRDVVLPTIFFALKQTLCPINELLLPLPNLDGMNSLFGGQLIEGFVISQGFYSDLFLNPADLGLFGFLVILNFDAQLNK